MGNQKDLMRTSEVRECEADAAMESRLGRSRTAPMAFLFFIVLLTTIALSEASRVAVQRTAADENVGAVVASTPELVLFPSAFVKLVCLLDYCTRFQRNHVLDFVCFLPWFHLI